MKAKQLTNLSGRSSTNVVVRPRRSIVLGFFFPLVTCCLSLVTCYADDAEIKLNSNDGSSNFVIQDNSGLVVSSVTSTGNAFFKGNVGIGTTSPSEKLEVQDGNIKINSIVEAYKNITFSNIGNSTQGSIIFRKNAGDSIAAKITTVGTYSYNRKGLAFYTGNYLDSVNDADERMRITESGNVGIGVSTPTAKLDVDGDLKLAVPLASTSGGTGRTNKLAAVEVIGVSSITSPGGYADMPDMLTTITTYGTKLLVMFSAPIQSLPGAMGYIYINIDNVDKRKLNILSPGTAIVTSCIAFQHLETDLTPGPHTVKIRWSGSTFNQYPPTTSERIMTVLDLE